MKTIAWLFTCFLMLTACHSIRYISKNFNTDIIVDPAYTSQMPDFKEGKILKITYDNNNSIEFVD